MRARLSFVLAIALVAVACGADEPLPEPLPAEDPGIEMPEPTEPTPEPTPPGDAGTHPALPEEIREVHDGVVDARPRSFERGRADETDGSLWVTYWTGVEPCNVLADIEVQADADQVTVTLFEGYLPDADGEPPICIMLAVEVAVRIPLDEPLGGRTLVDGTTGEQVEVDRITRDGAAAS